MANGTPRETAAMTDEARFNIGALQQRIFGLESGHQGLTTAMTSLTSRVETLFANLSAKIDDRSRPQWSLLVSLGLLGLAFVSTVGALAYWPIRETQSDLKLAVVEITKVLSVLPDRFITLRELDMRQMRTIGEFARINTDLRTLDAQVVPRNELAERWRSSDQQSLNTQRQIDELKKSFTDTFSLRDALLQMQRRLDGLEAAKTPH